LKRAIESLLQVAVRRLSPPPVYNTLSFRIGGATSGADTGPLQATIQQLGRCCSQKCQHYIDIPQKVPAQYEPTARVGHKSQHHSIEQDSNTVAAHKPTHSHTLYSVRLPALSYVYPGFFFPGNLKDPKFDVLIKS